MCHSQETRFGKIFTVTLFKNYMIKLKLNETSQFLPTACRLKLNPENNKEFKFFW